MSSHQHVQIGALPIGHDVTIDPGGVACILCQANTKLSECPDRFTPVEIGDPVSHCEKCGALAASVPHLKAEKCASCGAPLNRGRCTACEQGQPVS